jgi:hypothetical protein
LSAGEALKVTGTFTQGHKATLKSTIGATSGFGALSITGTAKLDGTLALNQTESFVGSLRQEYAILTSSALSGAFTKETGDTINSKPAGRYYRPTYSPTGIAVIVT